METLYVNVRMFVMDSRAVCADWLSRPFPGSQPCLPICVDDAIGERRYPTVK